MAYNKARAEKQWLKWKEAEERKDVYKRQKSNIPITSLCPVISCIAIFYSVDLRVWLSV